MGETPTQRRRVDDEGLRVVKSCQMERNVVCLIRVLFDGTSKEAPANSVPAAAVIRRVQALFGITGRKARVGGYLSQM